MKKLRKDTIGLNEELNRSKHLMTEADFAVVNKTDLDKLGNWSAKYITRKQQGLNPYDKTNYILTQLTDPKQDKLGTVDGPGDIRKSMSSKLKDAVYLKEEQAEELNQIGEQIQSLISQYNEIFQQYAKY